MPIYEFRCEDKLCEQGQFDELCKYEDIKNVKCPSCGTTNVEKLMSAPNLAFAQPKESSKWDNFGYRAGYNLEKAKGDRRKAQDLSHVGSNPYRESEKIDLEKYDITHHEGHID